MACKMTRIGNATLYNSMFQNVLYSSKLSHGPQFASICVLQKWGGGLYLRALDVDT